LLAQGELVHVATYISLPLVGGYDMVEAIKIRAGAHSFEGKLFTLVACGAISEEIIEILAGKDVGLAQRLRRTGSAFSGIFGPDGRLVTEPLIDEEGMRFADIDLNLCIQPKQMHDITGHYNRFDVFQLHIDKRQKTPLSFASPSTNAQVRTRIEGENGEDDAGLATWPDRIAKEPTRKVR
jgi:nitrilase